MPFGWQSLLAAAVGSFATAWVAHETGRDPRLGGIAGLLTGFFFGWFALASLWIWFYLNRLNARIVKKPTKWWKWWA